MADTSIPSHTKTEKSSYEDKGSQNTVWNETLTHDDTSHQAISSYFIGPQAENLPIFENNIRIILEELKKARNKYFPEDGLFITDAVKASHTFQACTKKLTNAVRVASRLLGSNSIPFWSPRYEAHMCTDMSMASLLGYFMCMLYNPNNVAIEASPISTIAEIEVGEQLCELFGYNLNQDDKSHPTAWGHVTCDGTVANLESIWVARNLKFFPFSLRKAMEDGAPLDFVASTFMVETCQGEEKRFSELDVWELLNLKPATVLDLSDRLYKEYGISSSFLSDVMNKYTIQSTGKDTLENQFDITKPTQYMLATTRHYSWPKGAAVCGIGSDNVVGIPVDHAARADMTALRRMLEDSLTNKQAVYAVVAIIGSTEEGAVDPLSAVLAMRKEFQTKGLSFLVHADAAWGGYFCSMLPKDYRPGDVVNLPTDMGAGDGFVPDASLRTETQEDLYAMRYADSITVDPHKAGYIPYPAGGLCYKDERMRFLVTWTSPYLSRGSVTSIGIYGIEGSKPGASAMSAWLSNKTIGLHPEGYGSLLAEVTYTCTRLSAEWAAMTDTKSPFVCVPFNELPSETQPGATPESVEAEKKKIREDILSKTNAQIVSDDAQRPESAKAMKLMRALGSDLNINAFALNFRLADGSLNDDIEEANYLMQRVVEDLSVDEPTDDPTKIPLYLTSTEFSDDLYGECKKHFVKRLGLEPSTKDLMVLRNVVMSPFPTDRNFISHLAKIFYDKVEEHVKVVRKRNETREDFYSFLVQGKEQIFLVHLPMFHEANHRQQLVMSVEFETSVKESFSALKNSSPNEPMILVTQHKVQMKDVVEQKDHFKAYIMTKESGVLIKDVKVSVSGVIASRPLNSKWRLDKYSQKFMPFYLYGKGDQLSIDHVLVRAPNAQFSASGCKFMSTTDNLTETQLSKGLLLCLDTVREAAMQPFSTNADIGVRNGIVPKSSSFFFKPGAQFPATVYEIPDAKDSSSIQLIENRGTPIASGTLVLGDDVYIDTEACNKDPYKREQTIDHWREQFDQIGNELD